MKIISNIRTHSKYGLVNPGDELEVGKDIDEEGAKRWLDAGIAKKGNLKTNRSPDSSNTVKEIKTWLDDNEVDYDSTLRKAELLEVVDAQG